MKRVEPPPPVAGRYALEGHYYAGGLQIRPLGGPQERPDWAPSPPDRYVGFRNEFALSAGDAIVEFARFAYRGSRVTWVAVYHRSVDEVYGDRGNHAGIGVWLNDALIGHPAPLLTSLSSLSLNLASKGPEAVQSDAAAFGGPDFLEKYLDYNASLPDNLSGWRFSPSPVCKTVSFYADGASGKDRIELAAEQISRASILPAPDPAQSRALILLPGTTASLAAADAGQLPKLGRPSLSEVTKVLPAAVRRLTEQARSFDARTHALEEELVGSRAANEDLSQQLDGERSEKAGLVEQNAHLTDQLAGDSTIRWLSTIDKKLAMLDSSVRTNTQEIGRLARDIRAPSPTPLPPPPPPSYIDRALDMRQSPALGPRHFPLWRYMPNLRIFTAIAIGIATLVLLILTWQWWNGPASSLDDQPLAAPMK